MIVVVDVEQAVGATACQDHTIERCQLKFLLENMDGDAHLERAIILDDVIGRICGQDFITVSVEVVLRIVRI